MNRLVSLPLFAMLCATTHAQEAIQPQQHPHEHGQSRPASEAADAYTSVHVPPATPMQAMPPMSIQEMNDIMRMDDTARFGKVTIEEAEWSDDGMLRWDLNAWYGGDSDKLWMRSEGEQASSDDSFSVEVLWDHVFARWWSVRGGLRYDDVAEQSRSSLVIGLRGLAPQWFHVESDLYLRDNGVATLHGEVDYDMLLTQRLVLAPTAKVTLNSRTDNARGAGAGLSKVEAGLRLRYEIRRELAPYTGVYWTRSVGHSADFAQQQAHDQSELQWLVGITAWF